LSANIASDTRNNTIFPTRGGSKRLSGEFTVPGSDIEYYKINYRQSEYFAVTRDLTLGLRGEIGYGDSYGSTSELPFFENFLAGGGSSVRGFEDNTLGQKDEFNQPLGGNFKTVGTAELIFPVPFVKDKNAFRFSGFFDFGNVFRPSENFAVDKLRYSVGLGATWLSPFGALTVSIAKPFNAQDNDQTKVFQFRFGQGFQ
jgi:outer membrane protein insertion porin family